MLVPNIRTPQGETHDEARDAAQQLSQLLVLVDERLDPRSHLVQLLILARLVQLYAGLEVLDVLWAAAA